MTEILYPRKTLTLLFWDSALFPLERFLSGSKSGQNKRGKKPQSRKIELPWPSCSVLQTEGIFQRRPPTSTGTPPRPSLSTAAYYLLSLAHLWRWKVSLGFYGQVFQGPQMQQQAVCCAAVDPSDEHHHWYQGATPERQPHIPGSGICRIMSFHLERITDKAGTLLRLELFCISITKWN